MRFFPTIGKIGVKSSNDWKTGTSKLPTIGNSEMNEKLTGRIACKERRGDARNGGDERSNSCSAQPRLRRHRRSSVAVDAVASILPEKLYRACRLAVRPGAVVLHQVALPRSRPGLAPSKPGCSIAEVFRCSPRTEYCCAAHQSARRGRAPTIPRVPGASSDESPYVASS